MPWQVIHSGCYPAVDNMKRDYELLQQLQSIAYPIYHDYAWEGDCATYGHFINPHLFLNAKAVARHQLHLAKRPTGGGIVFHLSDLAFSVLLPACHPSYSLNTLENYAFINQIVSQSISQFIGQKDSPALLSHEPAPLDVACAHFCMAKPTQYDVMLQGRKVGGGAQRRTKHGYLHQGSIAIAMPREEYLQEILLPNTCVLSAMKQHSFLLLDPPYSEQQLVAARRELKALLIENFCQSSS